MMMNIYVYSVLAEWIRKANDIFCEVNDNDYCQWDC